MAAYKEGEEAGEALFGKTEDEAEDNAGSDESPRAGTEAKDYAGFCEALVRRGPAASTMR